MRKSRILTLILTVVFILANVTIPSFADEISFTHGNPADAIPVTYIVGPVGNYPLHISHKVGVEGAQYGTSKSVAGMSVSADGILDITSAASPMTAAKAAPKIEPAVNVVVTDSNGESIYTGPQIARLYAGYEFKFDDDVNPAGYGLQNNGRYLLKNHTIESGYRPNNEDGSENKVAVMGSSTFNFGLETGLLHKVSTAPFVFEMDLLGLKGNMLADSNTGATFLKLNASYGIDADWANAASAKNSDFISSFNANDGEWHNYKWIITHSAYTKADGTPVASQLDLYIDNHMVVKGSLLTALGSNQFGGGSGNKSLRINATALDNLKRYGTSLGFAHDVKLIADNNTVGSTIKVDAQMASMPASNIPEALEREVRVSDTVDGTYATKLAVDVAADGSFTIPESAKGKYIKAAARVVETIGDQCATDWVLSDEYIYVTDVAIDSVSLSVNGVACDDLEADNIVTSANIAAGTAEVALTINAASASGKTVKFVLAQYNKVDSKSILKNVAVGDVALTSAGASCDLSLTASDLNADTEFKLFALTVDGLIPVDLKNLK